MFLKLRCYGVYRKLLHTTSGKNKAFEALAIVSKALGHQNTGTTMDSLGIRRKQIAKWQIKLNL